MLVSNSCRPRAGGENAAPKVLAFAAVVATRVLAHLLGRTGLVFPGDGLLMVVIGPVVLIPIISCGHVSPPPVREAIQVPSVSVGACTSALRFRALEGTGGARG